jgi:hypothetical protein
VQRVLANGQFFSLVAPAMGLLMLANFPPLPCSHFQTAGGVYSDVLMRFTFCFVLFLTYGL